MRKKIEAPGYKPVKGIPTRALGPLGIALGFSDFKKQIEGAKKKRERARKIYFGEQEI